METFSQFTSASPSDFQEAFGETLETSRGQGGQGGGASESEGVDIVRPGHFYNLHLDYKMGGVSEESVFRLESSRILSAEVGKGDRSIVITAPPHPTPCFQAWDPSDKIAGIPLRVKSAGLDPDWRFLACRSRSRWSEILGSSGASGTRAGSQQVGHGAGLRPLAPTRWSAAAQPRPLSRAGARLVAVLVARRGPGRAASLLGSLPQPRFSRAASDAGWWHLLGSGRWRWEAARQRALAVTKFPRTAGRIAPLPTTRDRLGKSSGILNWG